MICCFKGKFKITSPRGYRTLSGKREFHKGVDLVGIDDKTVYAVADGTIDATPYEASGFGYYIRQKLADGRRIYYAHLKKGSICVKPGQRIKAGDALGIMGATGRVTGAHTHLELRPEGTAGDSLDICEFCGIQNKAGTYSYVPAPTLDELIKKVKVGYSFENQTIDFLKKYEYAYSLFERLAEKL